MVVCDRTTLKEKPKMIKNMFFGDIEKFGGFFCFWSIMEIYVIDYIPVQLAYLGKI